MRHGQTERALHILRPVPRTDPPAPPRRRPIGERLVHSGALASGDLVRALALQTRQEARLGEILLAHRMVAEADLDRALSEQWSAMPVDLAQTPPEGTLVDALGAPECLARGLLPVRRVGAAVLVATARPDRFAAERPHLTETLGPVVMGLASEREIASAVAGLRGPALARRAERLSPSALSCRNWRGAPLVRATLGAVAALCLAGLLAPLATLWALTAFVMLTLAATAALKGLALGQVLRAARGEARRAPREAREAGMRAAPAPGPATPLRLPVITVLVPLYREEAIARRLIARLERLRYPRELTDIVLLVEQGDATTAAALARTRLPRHVRSLVVPPGTVQTKPRALNYGLGFARGTIVGIWDAEDAPDPDQLHAVAAQFARSAPRVACLQGVLDFYNARTNWLSRAFTLEYATWFRAILPGLQALDLPIPLGGTTLFFRRAALEELGGWDAHNVTEDADLGIRLYRAGYRTEMVDTVTREEANCRIWPWIRQRSRWLKGYAATWAVHMRRPRRLWCEMGPAGFLGFQALFVGTLAQFLLAPVMLSFWLLALGLPHPLSGQVPAGLGWAFLALVIVAEGISLGLTVLGNRAPERRRMLWWLPVLHLYYPLAAAAAYKGLAELMWRPFFWDKTAHGLYDEDGPCEADGLCEADGFCEADGPRDAEGPSDADGLCEADGPEAGRPGAPAAADKGSGRPPVGGRAGARRALPVHPARAGGRDQ
mgnify:CR=1 FL=1